MKKIGKWTRVLMRFSRLPIGGSLTVKGDDRYANRLRSMLHQSKRTVEWHWTVHREGEMLCVTKTGRWNLFFNDAPEAFVDT